MKKTVPAICNNACFRWTGIAPVEQGVESWTFREEIDIIVLPFDSLSKSNSFWRQSVIVLERTPFLNRFPLSFLCFRLGGGFLFLSGRSEPAREENGNQGRPGWTASFSWFFRHVWKKLNTVFTPCSFQAVLPYVGIAEPDLGRLPVCGSPCE